MANVKQAPKDAQVIVSIMEDMGIKEYEPKVINQLLEFTYRYVTCVLDDSKIYASHSKKKFIDADDVQLAVTMQLCNSYTNPPPREVLLDIAKTKNSTSLPFVKPSYGLRLPPDRYCLNNTNFKLKSLPKRTKKIAPSNTIPGAPSRTNQLGYSIVKRPGTMTNISRTQTISSSKPVFRVATSNSSLARTHLISKTRVLATPEKTEVPEIVVKQELDDSNKRKREDDDDLFIT
ncbi:hypothetical protein QAD02_022070 [Eretmocerus hayati]|uniref:Uncharacterized protein n=1 Tax=Eretmocerus hayati TaxID=131215 RepID=A0ACC2PU16_9HYME|nr:hypothetical protein QAD02_022070 [Eretmocerus hayati]